MTIYLDDEAAPFEADSLGSAIDAAQRTLVSTGRIVVEVRLDEKTLSGDQIDDCRDRPLAAAELRLYTAEPGTLALDTLGQVRERLDDARVLVGEAADLLQRDEPAGALARVADSIAIWLQTQQAVHRSAHLVGLELGALHIDGEPIESLTSGLRDQLETLKGLIETRDMVALADVLAYEWPEQVDRWDRLVGALAEKIEAVGRGQVRALIPTLFKRASSIPDS